MDATAKTQVVFESEPAVLFAHEQLRVALGSGLQAAASLDLLMAREWIAEKVACQGKQHLGQIVSMIGAMSRSLS
jgi:hypothetical protein